jgi:hypothetical protein
VEQATVESGSNNLGTDGNGSFMDVAVGFCNDNVPADGPHDVAQLNVVLTGFRDQYHGAIWHTIRATNPVKWNSTSQPTYWRPLHDLGHQINYPDYGKDRSEVGLWGGLSLGFRPYRPY